MKFRFTWGGGGVVTREEAARILGVPVDASPDDVVAAWKTLAQQVHPDRGEGNMVLEIY